MAEFENNNDQEQQQLSPEQQLAVTREGHRHKEDMERLAIENRKVDLDERRIVLQEKQVDSQISDNKAENETANKARLALLGLVEKGIDFLQNKVYPDYRLDKAQRWRFNEGLRAAREGIYCTFGADGSVSFTSTKVGVGIVMNADNKTSPVATPAAN